MKQIIIRLATTNDASACLAIYAPYVTATAITFEYEVPTLEDFTQRMETTLQTYPYLVAEQHGEIVGYAYASPLKTRPAYQWCVETSIYVKSSCKKHGIGKALYANLETLLTLQHVRTLYACISSPQAEDIYLNHDSIHFHEHLQYRLVGTWHACGYKFATWYDVVWMEKQLLQTEVLQPFVPFSKLPIETMF